MISGGLGGGQLAGNVPQFLVKLWTLQALSGRAFSALGSYWKDPEFSGQVHSQLVFVDVGELWAGKPFIASVMIVPKGYPLPDPLVDFSVPRLPGDEVHLPGAFLAQKDSQFETVALCFVNDGTGSELRIRPRYVVLDPSGTARQEIEVDTVNWGLGMAPAPAPAPAGIALGDNSDNVFTLTEAPPSTGERLEARVTTSEYCDLPGGCPYEARVWLYGPSLPATDIKRAASTVGLLKNPAHTVHKPDAAGSVSIGFDEIGEWSLVDGFFLAGIVAGDCRSGRCKVLGSTLGSITQPGVYTVWFMDPDGAMRWVKVSVGGVHLAVDADNDAGFSTGPDVFGTPAEEAIKKDATKPGKIIGVANGDADGDGIADPDDLYDFQGPDGGTDERPESERRHFVPVRVTLDLGSYPQTYIANCKLRFAHGTAGAAIQPLRVWTEDATVSRTLDPLAVDGSYVAAGEGRLVVPRVAYPLSTFFGVEVDAPKERIFYVEALSPSAVAGDMPLSVEIIADTTGGGSESGWVSTLADWVRVTVVKVDLGIDVDDDGDVDDTDEQMEESTGAIIFENLDNDDNDVNFRPDKEKTFNVPGENDLVSIRLKIEPPPTSGTVKLEATAGGNRIQFWTLPTKETEAATTWDLKTKTVPTALYLEGFDKSISAKDVQLKLSCEYYGTAIYDKVNITVVRQNLGIAVYRDLDMPWPWTPLGHAGLITGYTGKRTTASITNDASWVTTEMGSAGIHTSDLQTFIATRPPFRGSFSIANLGDALRNKILRNATDCCAAGIAYMWGDAISWNGPTWDGTIPGIHELRCDGLVEVCYELAGCEVWGQNGTHYLIQNWVDEHQNLGMGNPQLDLSPVVQRGGVANSPTRFVGDLLFQPQALP